MTDQPNSSNELLPCPFCKKTESLHILSEPYWHKVVICNALKNGCGARGGVREYEDEAIRVWNNRAPSGNASDLAKEAADE